MLKSDELNLHVGKTITVTQDEDQESVELDYYDDRDMDYLSIFGAIEITRSYYYKEGYGGLCPLDEQLNLPERKYSYLLQRWLSAYCVKDTYDEAVKGLAELLGVSIPKRPMQMIMQDVSQKADDFWAQQPAPGGDVQIVVISADGKGVPMKQPWDRESPKRLKKGQKRTKKKEAVAGIIYTISREGESSGSSQEIVCISFCKMGISFQGKSLYHQGLGHFDKAILQKIAHTIRKHH